MEHIEENWEEKNRSHASSARLTAWSAARIESGKTQEWESTGGECQGSETFVEKGNEKRRGKDGCGCAMAIEEMIKKSDFGGCFGCGQPLWRSIYTSEVAGRPIEVVSGGYCLRTTLPGDEERLIIGDPGGSGSGWVRAWGVVAWLISGDSSSPLTGNT